MTIITSQSGISAALETQVSDIEVSQSGASAILETLISDIESSQSGATILLQENVIYAHATVFVNEGHKRVIPVQGDRSAWKVSALHAEDWNASDSHHARRHDVEATLDHVTTETDTGLVLKPDGAGGVEWGTSAPSDATYLVNSADATLTNEIVVTAAQGSLIYGNPAWDVLPIGAAGTVLTSNGASPSWQPAGVLSFAPIDATYLVVSLNGDLTAERNLVINDGLEFVDNGANGSFQIDLGTPSDVTSISANGVTASSHTHALDATGVAAGSYGSATQVGTFTVDTKGRLTAASNVVITGTPPLVHDLLGIYHGDTVANAVTQGSLIYGNATPLWDELLIGAAGTILYSNGTVPSWATLATAGIVGGSGTIGRVTQWATASTIEDSNLIGPAANVLTLTAGAAYTLDVPATGTAALLERAQTFTAANVFQNAVQSTGALVVNNSAGTRVFTVDTTNRRVGAGTANPDETLHVVGRFKASDSEVDNANKTTFWLGEQYEGSTEEGVSLLIGSFVSGKNSLRFGGSSGSYNAATEILFFTAPNSTTLSGTEKMRIAATTGNVLIGTTTDGMTTGGSLRISQDLRHDGTYLGFYGATPITKPTVVGARDDPEAALANLLAALASLGLITDSTTAT